MHYEFLISPSSRLIYLQSSLTFSILPIFFYIFNVYFEFDVLYEQYVKWLNKIIQRGNCTLNIILTLTLHIYLFLLLNRRVFFERNCQFIVGNNARHNF